MKNKETLRIEAHKMLIDYGIKSISETIGVHKVKELMVDFAKAQTTAMFSEEDMKKSYEHGKFAIIEMGHGDTFEEFIEKFKNKIK
jgi:hypothetical protein